jgi:myo-inositol 2-dehydrogenase/D-chiro-inositol 1-dehydrogenase
MRIGLIGAGRIGATHARVLSTTPGVDELVITDVVSGRAAALAERHEAATAVASSDEVLERVDAVVIASSTDTHASLLEAAAAYEVTTFCEKPIALDLESTRRAVAAVDAAGIPVQMGFQRRYDPAIAGIHDRIASGELGLPYLVRSQTHDPSPPPMTYIAVSGGIFRDCLIHDIDAVRFVTGQEVTTVTAAGAATGFPEIADHGDVATATVIMSMSDGTLAQLSALRHDPIGYDVRLEVFAPGGSVAAGWGPRSPIHSAEPGVEPPNEPMVEMFDRFAAAFRTEMEAFVRVVRGEGEPASNHHDAYEDLRVAVACDLSRIEGRTVALEEIP